VKDIVGIFFHCIDKLLTALLNYRKAWDIIFSKIFCNIILWLYIFYLIVRKWAFIWIFHPKSKTFNETKFDILINIYFIYYILLKRVLMHFIFMSFLIDSVKIMLFFFWKYCFFYIDIVLKSILWIYIDIWITNDKSRENSICHNYGFFISL